MDDMSRPRVLSFESRRHEEMRNLIKRHGGEPLVAPSMQEVPLSENSAAMEFLKTLRLGQVDVVVFLTGVGARGLLELVEADCDKKEFCALLARCAIVVRGPKPAKVMREWGVAMVGHAAEPNTWRQLIPEIERVGCRGRVIAIQEYGVPSLELYESLEDRGATVIRVPVYRWSLPDDTRPLEAAVAATVAGKVDVLLFTSANQLTNVLAIAEKSGVRDAWLEAAQKCMVGSVGPTASARLREVGVDVDVEPGHAKMGPLVRETLAVAISRTRPPSSPAKP